MALLRWVPEDGFHLSLPGLLNHPFNHPFRAISHNGRPVHRAVHELVSEGCSWPTQYTYVMELMVYLQNERIRRALRRLQ